MNQLKYHILSVIIIVNILTINTKESFDNFLQDKIKTIGNYTKEVLDIFSRMQGEMEFPQDVWNELYKYLNSSKTPNLLEASNNGWKGVLQHGQENRTNDPWINPPSQYHESNFTHLAKIDDLEKVIIFAPCATVSNIAYYRTFLTICGHEKLSRFSFDQATIQGFKKGFVFETFSSAFWHASGSHLGWYSDNRVEDLWNLIIHQASLSSLPRDAFLLNLDETSSEILAVEIMDIYENMFLNFDVYKWESVFKKYQYTSIYKSMGALLSTGLALTLPIKESQWVVTQLGKILIPNDYNLIVDKYLPKLSAALELKKVNVSIRDKIILIKKIIGVIVKLSYGVIFQEELIRSDFLTSEKITYMATLLMPIFNKFSNFLTGYDHYTYIFDQLQQKSRDVYPGRKICGGKRFSHNIWHEQTANALVDLFYLADDINRLISGQNLN